MICIEGARDGESEVHKGEFKKGLAQGYGEKIWKYAEGGENKTHKFCGRFHGKGLMQEGTETRACGTTGRLSCMDTRLLPPFADIHCLFMKCLSFLLSQHHSFSVM